MLLSGVEIPVGPNLRLVRIYFDTATFDDIERDKKIKTEAQLSLIGGTMGLFSGFSIISGVEIIFFVAKFLYKSIAHCKEKLGGKDTDKSKIENENVKDDNNDDTLI